MSDISTFRLYLLRAGYLVFAVGLALMMWSGIIRPPETLPHMNTVVRSMLGAVSLLALLGVRYPLKMLPVLFFELLWKTIWICAFGLRAANRLDADMQDTMFNCIFGIVLVLIVLPWVYIYRSYLQAAGDRWGKNSASSNYL